MAEAYLPGSLAEGMTVTVAVLLLSCCRLPIEESSPSMQTRRTTKSLLAVGVLLSALSLPVFSQQPQENPPQDQNQRDRMATTLTGCLNKEASGSFVITDSSGLKTTVSGAADLEKHANNHKVSLKAVHR